MFARQKNAMRVYRITVSQIVWSLNAQFQPDRDKADKSAKLCIQFPWDMSMKSEMGAQEKKLPITV